MKHRFSYHTTLSALLTLAILGTAGGGLAYAEHLLREIEREFNDPSLRLFQQTSNLLVDIGRLASCLDELAMLDGPRQREQARFQLELLYARLGNLEPLAIRLEPDVDHSNLTPLQQAARLIENRLDAHGVAVHADWTAASHTLRAAIAPIQQLHNDAYQQLHKRIVRQVERLRRFHRVLLAYGGSLLLLGGSVGILLWRQFGTVPHLQALVEQWQQRAHTDALTGLYNRRAFFELLEHEMSRAMRHRRPLSVAFLDLDDFRAVNAAVGSASGDRILVAVAATLRRSLRRSDIACRYGGDDFCVILSETTQHQGVEICRRLAAAIDSVNDIAKGRLRLNFGVCQTGPEQFCGVDMLVRKAEQRMRASQGASDLANPGEAGETG